MDDQIMSRESNFTFVSFNAFTTPQKKGFVSQPYKQHKELVFNFTH